MQGNSKANIDRKRDGSPEQLPSGVTRLLVFSVCDGYKAEPKQQV